MDKREAGFLLIGLGVGLILGMGLGLGSLLIELPFFLIVFSFGEPSAEQHLSHECCYQNQDDLSASQQLDVHANQQSFS